MSSEDQVAYDLLADLFSNIEATNTWLTMTLEAPPDKAWDDAVVRWRETLEEQKQEWEELTGEPLKVIGSCS